VDPTGGGIDRCIHLERRALKVSCLVEDEARAKRCSVAAHEKADANLRHWAPGCKGSWLWPRDPIHKKIVERLPKSWFGIDPLPGEEHNYERSAVGQT